MKVRQADKNLEGSPEERDASRALLLGGRGCPRFVLVKEEAVKYKVKA